MSVAAVGPFERQSSSWRFAPVLSAAMNGYQVVVTKRLTTFIALVGHKSSVDSHGGNIS